MLSTLSPAIAFWSIGNLDDVMGWEGGIELNCGNVFYIFFMKMASVILCILYSDHLQYDCIKR